MPVIVGQQYSYVECDTCYRQTEKIYGLDSGERAANDAIEKQWHVSLITGNAKCPQCIQKDIERARRTLQ